MNRTTLGLVLLMAALAVACGGEDADLPSPTGDESPQASGTPTVAPPAYLIDGTVYDAAREAERAIRAQDARALLAGSKWDSDLDRDRAASTILNMLYATGGVPRLVSVGCFQVPGEIPSCLHAFAVTMSSLPPGLEERDTRGMVVLTYLRQGSTAVAAGIAFPEGAARRAAVEGGPSDQCAFSQPLARPSGECIPTVFYPYSTGPVPTPTTAARPGP